MSRFKTCLIVTYGRSGSTLLQGLLNTIPGWLIRGENENFVFFLYRAYGMLRGAIDGTYAGDTSLSTNPWYGLREIDMEEFKIGLRTIVRNALVPGQLRDSTRCFGFKEIRYLFMPEELGLFLKFLDFLFDDLVIIFNFRSIDDVVQSDWWRNADADDTRAKIRRFEQAAMDFNADRTVQSLIVSYDKIIQDRTAIKALFDFIDEPLDQNSIDVVLSKTHSTRTLKQ